MERFAETTKQTYAGWHEFRQSAGRREAGVLQDEGPRLRRHFRPAVRPPVPGRPLRPRRQDPPARQDQERGPEAARPAAPQAGHALLRAALHAHVPVLPERLLPAGAQRLREPRHEHELRGEGRVSRGHHPHLCELRGPDHLAPPGGRLRREDLLGAEPDRAAGAGAERRLRPDQHPTQALLDIYTLQPTIDRRDRRQEDRHGGRPHARPHRALAHLPHEELQGRDDLLRGARGSPHEDDIKAFLKRHAIALHETDDLEASCPWWTPST